MVFLVAPYLISIASYRPQNMGDPEIERKVLNLIDLARSSVKHQPDSIIIFLELL